ncbi:hypothetical protein GCM10027521_05800 [Amycolatopsis cihanbeyliensis]
MPTGDGGAAVRITGASRGTDPDREAYDVVQARSTRAASVSMCSQWTVSGKG